MNWDRIEGNWKQFKGKVKQQWGKLTDDQVDVISGKRDQLVGAVQETYGIARDEADEQHGQACRDDQEGHLRGAGAEDEQRDERDGRPRHDGTKLRDGLPEPQLQEIGVSPERRDGLDVGTQHDA